MSKKTVFTQRLLAWFATNHRPMPWKGEKNPYFIWLSEIILQQTTVRQGMPYYERFIENYPTVKELAEASQDDVMKLWEGLGYYSRARNLHATAKHISEALNGAFPTNYEGLLKLKGVGTYTAAAIASFAYNLPHAVLDGNVYRVLSRVFDIEEPIDTPQAKRLFTELANELLDKNRASDFNQAIMDFGATQCTPSNPNCNNCPLKDICTAFLEQKTAVLPIKGKKNEKKTRYFNYLVINAGNRTFIQKRQDKDIWQNLYEFPLIETSALMENFADKTYTEGVLSPRVLGVGGVNPSIKLLLNYPYKVLKKSQPYKQLLTHRVIIATFWEIEVGADFSFSDENILNIERKNLTKFAFSKVIDLYFRDKVLTLF